MYYSIENGYDIQLEKETNKDIAIQKAEENPEAQAIFEFDDDHELIDCVWKREV